MLYRIKRRVYDLLRASERYTKTDMVYLTKGGFWITFGQFVSSVLSLALLVAFANLLPKETYGIYRYVLALAGVLNIFTLTGMASAVTRAVATGEEGVFRASVRYQLKWNLLMLAAFWILSGYYFVNGDLSLAMSFFILGVFVPSTLALSTYGSYLEGKRKFQVASIATIISTLVYVAGAFVAILLSGEVIWLVIAYAVTTFVSTLFFYLFVVQKLKPSGAADDRDTLTYGRNLSFIRIIGPIASQIDKIILTQFWGPAQLATYSIAMAVPSRVIPFMKSPVGIGYPKFATKTASEINSVFYRRILQGVSIGIVIAVLYVLVAPYLFKYLLPQYLDGVFYSQILAASFIFAMPNRYTSLVLESQKLTRQVLIVNIANSTLAILLYTVLGIWGGILGLVIAHVLISSFSMLINIAVWRKRSRT